MPSAYSHAEKKGAGGRRFRRQAAQLTDHRQILEAAQMRIKVRFFGHVPNALLVGDQVVVNRLSLKINLARSGFHQAGDHFHCRGFAGPIQPKVASDFAWPCRKADVVHGGTPFESLANVAQFEHARSLRHPM
ncbi:MAG: hypothetical protein WA639_25060 [Candidatus Acidiferrum sp.]